MSNRNLMNLAQVLGMLANRDRDDDVIMGNSLSSSSSASVDSTLESFLSNNNNNNESKYFVMDRGGSSNLFDQTPSLFSTMGSGGFRAMAKPFDEDLRQYIQDPYIRDREVEMRLKAMKDDFKIPKN
ncbi:predicted protein [Naegleria gruberi]|uniref:Predicted protein n=1 Tax=Naegleria gruberi TaxID=5762 RepID=D2VW46_NAEGR|nr:uncharacterized protein NAEGRDRAFT_73246 [Naegleria gruberi]EFC38952.1 predicted protein [Naegleria gruberi]|eukprot:XP_002671696.1 predicted protein [Naegleria gruberi strain NEG-M]